MEILSREPQYLQTSSDRLRGMNPRPDRVRGQEHPRPGRVQQLVATHELKTKRCCPWPSPDEGHDRCWRADAEHLLARRGKGKRHTHRHLPGAQSLDGEGKNSYGCRGLDPEIAAQPIRRGTSVATERCKAFNLQEKNPGGQHACGWTLTRPPKIESLGGQSSLDRNRSWIRAKVATVGRTLFSPGKFYS